MFSFSAILLFGNLPLETAGEMFIYISHCPQESVQQYRLGNNDINQ